MNGLSNPLVGHANESDTDGTYFCLQIKNLLIVKATKVNMRIYAIDNMRGTLKWVNKHKKNANPVKLVPYPLLWAEYSALI